MTHGDHGVIGQEVEGKFLEESGLRGLERRQPHLIRGRLGVRVRVRVSARVRVRVRVRVRG